MLLNDPLLFCIRIASSLFELDASFGLGEVAMPSVRTSIEVGTVFTTRLVFGIGFKTGHILGSKKCQNIRIIN